MEDRVKVRERNGGREGERERERVGEREREGEIILEFQAVSS